MSKAEKGIGQADQPDGIQISAEELRALQRNDARVWGEIYERYTPTLLKIAMKRVGEGNAEDIVQDVWTSFQEYAQKGTLIPGTLFNYLKRATVLRATDHWRVEYRRPMSYLEDLICTSAEGQKFANELPDQGTTIVEEVFGRDDELRRELTDKIGEDSAQVIFLASEGMTHNEIAEMYGIKENNARIRKFRAREKALASLDMISKATGIPQNVLEERKRKAEDRGKKKD